MYENYRRKNSLRRRGWDYSRPNIYMVTICAWRMREIFGRIDEGAQYIEPVGEMNNPMKLSKIGEFADKCWREISNHYPHVYAGEYVIMPNHMHGILQILGTPIGAQYSRPLYQNPGPLYRYHESQRIIPGSLGSIVRGYKIGVTKMCNAMTGAQYIEPIWHRNFHESLIKDQNGLYRVREYIRRNPENYHLS